jgi:hypothetical protein
MIYCVGMLKFWSFAAFCLGGGGGVRGNSLLGSRSELFCFKSGLRSFLLEFDFRGFLLGFCASFLFERWRQGKCFVEFARLIFWFVFVGLAQFFVWLSQSFVGAAVGASFGWACGDLILFGYRLFLFV